MRKDRAPRHARRACPGLASALIPETENLRHSGRAGSQNAEESTGHAEHRRNLLCRHHLAVSVGRTGKNLVKRLHSHVSRTRTVRIDARWHMQGRNTDMVYWTPFPNWKNAKFVLHAWQM